MIVGAIAGLQAFHAFWTASAPAGSPLTPWLANLLIDSSHAIATVLVLCVAVRYRGSRVGLGWGLVGLGLLFGQFGESSWSFQELVLQREVPFPSVSDIGYVGVYFPVFLGLLLMPASPVSGPSRLKLILDTLILMSALAVVSWFLVIDGLLSETGQSALAQALSVFYPFADLGVIFAAFILVARAGRSQVGLAFALLGAGYFAAAFSDSLYTYLIQVGYETGNLIDIGWVASNTLISLAALVRLSAAKSLTRQPSPHVATPTFWPSLIPYLAILPLAVLLILDARGGQSSTLLTTGIMVVVAVTMLRQILSIYEDARLNRELAELSVLLEAKVKEKTMEMLRRDHRPGGASPATGQRPNGADEPVGGLGHLPER